MEGLTFTVVICTKDRIKDLSRCLKSLAESLAGEKPGQWDVLIVDNASSDGTGDQACVLAEGYPVRLSVTREERLGLAIARNTGLREARGEIVIFVDDDITFFSGWISAWEKAFLDDSLAAAGGPIIPVFPDSVPDWYREGVIADGGTTGLYEHGCEVSEYEADNGVGHPRGGNMAIRRMLALQSGGFREDLGWGKKKIPGEETEFFKRLHAEGNRILYLPGARVHHHLNESQMNLKHFREWHEGYGRASILMKPPVGHLSWSLKFIEQALNLAWGSLRLTIPGGARNFRAHRKQRQAIGRISQMIGL